MKHHADMEAYWQRRWTEDGVYRTSTDTSKPKDYVLDMFPYPSGTGLHIGHPEGYVATDIVSRFYRMNGYNVLHPMGFDAFGLPTERQAMKENIHPAIITERNIATFTRQLDAIGFDYDWSHSVNTTTADYVRWTQWMFLKIYDSWYDAEAKRARPIAELPIPEELTAAADIEAYRDSFRLAYSASIPVNWCEELGTVLANEEVDEWKEKGYTVERRPMRQWMSRITAYAERLLEDLNGLNWPSSTLEMQRHWIGRSIGAEVQFPVEGSDDVITVFTTRPDTLFGATYLVLAPEHRFVETLVTEEQRTAVHAYREAAALKSDLERTELAKEKTGVFTGAYALHPVTGNRVPIWIADYVLAHYGTGAIMAVPGHDERDFAFATEMGLPIVRVVAPSEADADSAITEPFVVDGVNVNSATNDVSLNGQPTAKAKETMISWLVSRGLGRATVQYRLRDWLFSRQRYWGEPIPIIHFDDGSRRAFDADELPLLLPPVESFMPAGTGESPLATVETWVNYDDPKTGRRGRLETNTMPQWAGSCWYYLRYPDPQNTSVFCDPDKERYWLHNGVDLYIGGGEHAVLHLLYARFWHKVLYDYGLVTAHEPFRRLFHQGLILGEDGRKMSKSLGNTIDPDDVIREHGADALRLYEMFLGPLETSKPWNTRGIDGITRFLGRVWRLVVADDDVLSAQLVDAEPSPELRRTLHTTIKKTREDIEALSFNTTIAQFMMFVNDYTAAPQRPRIAIEQFLQCLAPFAPHITEELWHRLGHTTSIHLSAFPHYDESALVLDEVEIVLQVNSKIRGKIVVPANADAATLESTARNDDNVRKYIEGKDIKKVIVVPGKLVNIIA